MSKLILPTILCIALATAGGCGRQKSVPVADGPVKNDYFEPVELKRFDTGEVLSPVIVISGNEAFSATFEVRGKPTPPQEYLGSPTTPVEGHPCLLATYPPGTKPNLKARPGGEPTVVFAAICRNPDHPQIPISGFGTWTSAIPEEQRPGSIKESTDASVPYYTILGKTHPTPGDYHLDLYTYPAARMTGRRMNLGEPLLIWQGTLRLTE